MSLVTVYMSKAPGDWQSEPLPMTRDSSLDIEVPDSPMRGLSYNDGLATVFRLNDARVQVNYATDGYWEIAVPKEKTQSFAEGVSNQDPRLQVTMIKPPAKRLAA